MKILLTGARGFIGSHLLPSLIPQHEVFALSRSPNTTVPQSGSVQWIAADLSDPPSLSRVLPERVDAIFHLAQDSALDPNGPRAGVISATSARALADYARHAKASRFIYASSGNVYERNLSPHPESDPTASSDAYAAFKLEAEANLSAFQDHFKVCILRIFAPYGPGQRHRMIPKIVDLVRLGQPVVLTNDGQPFINPLYIDDLIWVMHRALLLPQYELVNIAGPEPLSVEAIAVTAGKQLGREPVFERRKDPVQWNLLADTRHMHQVFPKDQPWVSLREGLSRLIEAFRDPGSR